MLSFSIGILFSAITGTVVAAAQSAAADPHHTRVQLVADVTAIQPGSTFSLGILMTMDPGWHTYWRNPGEAGLATQVEWTMPDGLTPGEILWPIPHKYAEGGEVITYGYEKENFLIVQVTAARNLKPGTNVVIRAGVNWLECEKICVPGDAEVEVSLPVKAGPANTANEELFRRYQALIPGTFISASGFSLRTVTQRRYVDILLAPAEGRSVEDIEMLEPDFLPFLHDELAMGRTSLLPEEQEVTLRVPLALFERGKAPSIFRGLLVYRSADGERVGGVVDVPLGESFVAGLPVEGETADQSGSVLDREFSIANADGGGEPLYMYVLFALIGGLLLNIMPCVLPVIGLKVFGLVRMGGENPAAVRRLGFFFSLGILASFLVLALLVIVLKTAGTQVGWGFQFQEPLFVIVMSVVVFAFGLSLFGVYEIRLPGAAVSGVSDAVSRAGGGASGSFWEGVFATILATPCTAPILGTALGFAFAQPGWIILLIFTAVAIGMALPYLVLTSRPAWMKLMPRPGEWMVTAKQFMGFLMMGTLLWLLYVLGKQLGMEAVVWTSAFLLMIGVACWLIGRFATLSASRARHALVWIASALVVAAGYWLFLQPVMDAKDALFAGPSAEVSAADAGHIRWEPFTVEGLDRHLADGKGVFIDFTAEWCLTCKVNEKTVLADADVVTRLTSSGLVPIKADWTSRNPDITRLLAKFGRSGVPLYVVFPPGKPSEPLILPEVITPGIVIEAIEKSRGKERIQG
jgi:thiol:disulfide interchange protein DsbD